MSSLSLWFVASFVTILNIDVRVTEGDPARLECRADSSVRASSISWSKNGQQLYR